MLLSYYRASDLKRQVDATSKSSAKAAEALRKAQNDTRTAQQTIEQLQSELKMTKADYAACQKSLEQARSESNTQFEEVRKCREEQRAAIAKAEAAQKDATEKMVQIRKLEFEATQVSSSTRATSIEGEQPRETSRRKAPQQQPGLVITPEALNWFVKPAHLPCLNRLAFQGS